MAKTVYSFDPGSRIYIGPVLLDDTDLSPLEEGVYLIPGDCLEVAPPEVPPGFLAVAQATAWALEPIPEPPAPPPPPIPTVVTRRQAHLALLAAGLLDQTEALIDGIADTTAKRRAQIEWAATTYERASPFLQQLAAQLGLDAAALDGLFTQAAGL